MTGRQITDHIRLGYLWYTNVCQRLFKLSTSYDNISPAPTFSCTKITFLGFYNCSHFLHNYQILKDIFEKCSFIEKLGPGTKSKVQVQRRSLGPKHFAKFGLHTYHHHIPHNKLLGHFRGRRVSSPSPSPTQQSLVKP